MWRALAPLAANLTRRAKPHHRIPLAHRALCTAGTPSAEAHPPPPPPPTAEEAAVSHAEARRLMRLVNVETLKRRLVDREVIGYSDFLRECEGLGLVRTPEEAAGFAAVLDQAGVVLLFRDKVYLHPDKVVDLMRKAVPLALTSDDDPGRKELEDLQKQKEDIDVVVHRQVRHILWSGLGFLVCQTGLFFRLTFWEFSWDVMEPVTFFTTTTGLIIGYAYFLFTSRDPTYQDFRQRLFLSRQRKLYLKQKFDLERYLHLQRRCKCDLDDPKGSLEHVVLKR